MNERKSQVVEAVAELKTDLKECMAEVRRDFKEIARRLDGSPVESQSPLRLSEKGESISDKLKAKQWAKSTAPELADRPTGKTRYEIQEACFERASTDDFEENAEMTRGILDCAFDHACSKREVRDVLGIELRDAVLERMGLPLSN